MVCAVIDQKTNKVINKIVASPTDFPPFNCFLVQIPENSRVDTENWYWNGTDFYNPDNTGNEEVA